MKNRLSDLNDHLFAQMGRLDGAKGASALTDEVKRAAAMVAVADQIVGIAAVQVQAAKLYGAHGDKVLDYLPAIGRSKAVQIEGKVEK